MNQAPCRRLPVVLVLSCLSLSLVLYYTVTGDVYTQISTGSVKGKRDTIQEMYVMMSKLTNDVTTQLKRGSGNPKRRGNPVIIPNRPDLEKMAVKELEEIYYLYIENLQTHCTRQRHIGNENDGGYHICEDTLNRSGTEPCLMYSFGNRKDFSFDDGVSKQYGCYVHSFDPFDRQVDHQHSPTVAFHSLGIAGTDGPDGKLLTLNTIKSKLNHTQARIDILKIDTEGAEWDSLTEMCKTDMLKTVKLLIVEFHVCIQPPNCMDGKHRTPQQYLQYFEVFRCLFDMGFRTYYFRMWPFCHFIDAANDRTTCHEVHMLNESL